MCDSRRSNDVRICWKKSIEKGKYNTYMSYVSVNFNRSKQHSLNAFNVGQIQRQTTQGDRRRHSIQKNTNWFPKQRHSGHENDNGEQKSAQRIGKLRARLSVEKR